MGRAGSSGIEDTDWGRITRVHPFPTDKRNIPARAARLRRVHALWPAMAACGRVRDPMSCWRCRRRSRSGLAGWAVARARRRRSCSTSRTCSRTSPSSSACITNAAVIAVASPARTHQVPRRRRGHRAVRRPARQRRAKIAGRPTAAERVRVIPNFVDTERIRPSTGRTPTGPSSASTGKTVVMYAGNVGFSQSLDLVLDGRRRSGDESDVVFVDQRRRLGPARAREARPPG